MIGIRDLVRRRIRSVIAVAGLGFVLLLVAWTHGSSSAMQGDRDDMHEGQLLLMCTAVLAVGVGALARTPGLRLRARGGPPLRLGHPGAARSAESMLLNGPFARAGPPELQVFRR